MRPTRTVRVRRVVAATGALVLLLAGLTAQLLAEDDRVLDPRSYAPDGAHALAALLTRRGVATAVVTDPGMLRPAPDLTVLVPEPDNLGSETVTGLRRAGARVVLVGAGQTQLDDAGLAVTESSDAKTEEREPDCPQPVALRAGRALTGGTAYMPNQGRPATGCYRDGSGASLLFLDGDRTVLLGSGVALENRELDRAGDASLALGLLASPRVTWFLPTAPPLAEAHRRSVADLLPYGVLDAALLVLAAVVLLALARGRRWGRLVVEPLPVAVPAAEVVEGTGRLYAAARARATAAEALRRGARRRLLTALRLPPGTEPPVLAAEVAARSARSAGEVSALLYGPEPPDDPALVVLAGALDDIEAEVRQP